MDDFWALMWGPVWFVVDMIILGAEFYFFYRWIHSGITETRDGVLSEFQNKETAAKVKTAMDIPDRADLDKISAKVEQTQISLSARVDALAGSIRQDVDAAIGKLKMPDPAQFADAAASRIRIPDPKIDLEGVEDRVAKALESKITGEMGAEARRRKREMEDMTRQYMESAQAQYDAQLLAATLQKMGVQPGVSQLAATYGPPGFEWALEYTFGAKRANDLLNRFQTAKERLQGPVQGYR